MPWSQFTRLVTLALVCTGSLSCEPKVQEKSWEPLDYNAALDEMYSLTGRIESLEVPSDELDKYLKEYVPHLRKQALFLGGTLDMLAKAAKADPAPIDAGDGDDPPDMELVPEADTEAKVTGTFLFIEVACPGPNSFDFGRDFDYGLIRIDSSNLNSFDMHDWTKGADLLLQFEECQSPGGTVTENTTAYLMGGFFGLIADLRPFDFYLGSIQATYAYITSERKSVLIDTGETGTFRLELTETDDGQQIRFRAKNGAILCQMNIADGKLFGCSTTKS